MFKIEDNYIDAEKSLSLRLMMESDIFPWFFLQGKVTKKDELFDYQFVHIFYKNYSINSDYFKHLNPLIDKLKPLSLIRIKANLNPISNQLIKFDKHQDQFFKCKTAIYYVNDNNGYTMISRARGRLVAIQIANTSTGESWRYGTFRLDAQPDGRR